MKTKRQTVTVVVNEVEETLYDANLNCDHKVEPQWSGIKCVKCGGWYCA